MQVLEGHLEAGLQLGEGIGHHGRCPTLRVWKAFQGLTLN
jgi:hypothetical protein